MWYNPIFGDCMNARKEYTKEEGYKNPSKGITKKDGVRWIDGHAVVDIDISRSDRICSGCEQYKPFSEFSRSKLVRDGYNYQCKACIKIAKDDWKGRNRDYYLESERVYSKKYREKNLDKVKAIYADWAKANRAHLNNRDAIRRAKKLLAVPLWADKKAIGAFYKEAKHLTEKSGTEYQVDHIVPLVSELVCGLHCEQNLQLLTKSENASKGNKMWPDTP